MNTNPAEFVLRGFLVFGVIFSVQILRWVLVRSLVAVSCWYFMLASHEFGHVLHAWLVGVKISNVDFPILGFPYTNVDQSPRPPFVVLGGFICGIAMPLAIWTCIATCRVRRIRSGRVVAQFLAGFCLVANGAYMGAGAIERVGDSAELLAHGISRSALVIIGALLVCAGLFIWHRIDRGVNMRSRPTPTGNPTNSID